MARKIVTVENSGSALTPATPKDEPAFGHFAGNHVRISATYIGRFEEIAAMHGYKVKVIDTMGRDVDIRQTGDAPPVRTATKKAYEGWDADRIPVDPDENT